MTAAPAVTPLVASAAVDVVVVALGRAAVLVLVLEQRLGVVLELLRALVWVLVLTVVAAAAQGVAAVAGEAALVGVGAVLVALVHFVGSLPGLCVSCCCSRKC
eukprot:4472785-Karenia_brevis.AAC.1